MISKVPATRSLPDVSGLSKLPAHVWRSLAGRLMQLGVTAEVAAPIARAARHLPDPLRPAIRQWHLDNVDNQAGYAMRLLMFGGSVSGDQAYLALGDRLAATLLRAGLIEEYNGYVRSPFYLNMVNDLFLLCDDLSHGRRAVMGAGQTTMTLCQAAHPTERVASILDLGCGAGAVALLLASQASISIGTDINPRAVELARINRKLNGARIGGSTRFLVSDLFSELTGRQFELIVAQPPYVPKLADARPAAYLYGGVRGDELPLRLLTQLPGYLGPTGRAVLLIEWPVIDDRPVEQRVRDAVAGADVSVLVLQMPPHADLDDYCLRYAAFFHPRLGPAFERTALRLRQHLDSVGIREFQPSLVVLQRDNGRPAWVSTVQGVQQDFVSAAEIDALIAARQFLVHGDAGLLGATLRVPANVLLQRESAFGADAKHAIRLRFAGQSMLPAIDCSPASLRLVQQVDSAATVADALRDLHAEDAEIPRLVDSVRAAVLRGMLQPVAVSARPTR